MRASESSMPLASPNYDTLVHQGHYGTSPQGLWGKYDNVRRFWENQVSRFCVRGAIARLQAGRFDPRLRILDLGCGSGEGWELLTRIPAGTKSAKPYLLAQEDIGHFHGVDLSPEMVQEANSRHGHRANTAFEVCDLRKCDDFLRENDAYDVYYNSYGSLSHLQDNDLHGLLHAVGEHQRGACVVVVDVHGQYSLEWPCYWGYSRDRRKNRLQPYSMTWLYPPEEQESHREEFREYRVRYWGGYELRRFLASIPSWQGRIGRIRLVDRSILVGRHMDTGDFNEARGRTRSAVNALFEFNQLSPAADLRIDSVPAVDDPEIASFLDDYRETWNALAAWFERLAKKREGRNEVSDLSRRFRLPDSLKKGLEMLVAQRDHFDWLEPGDPVSNLLQPQFGLLLRQLEYHKQRGLGCGHGLVAVVELTKAR